MSDRPRQKLKHKYDLLGGKPFRFVCLLVYLVVWFVCCLLGCLLAPLPFFGSRKKLSAPTLTLTLVYRRVSLDDDVYLLLAEGELSAWRPSHVAVGQKLSDTFFVALPPI